MSHGFRPLVVSDCVGDRALGPHEANLFDMEQKYVAVMAREAALQALGLNRPATAWPFNGFADASGDGTVRTAFVLMVRPDFPANTAHEFLSHARANIWARVLAEAGVKPE